MKLFNFSPVVRFENMRTVVYPTTKQNLVSFVNGTALYVSLALLVRTLEVTTEGRTVLYLIYL